uniref:Ribokinase n=1 Tax=Aureoumbra lagunensis TaxID=44058 RepID=A0A7S3K022_9STRA
MKLFWVALIAVGPVRVYGLDKKIFVVGSVNWDETTRVERLPKIGETVRARSRSCCAGGKGLNQGIAAVRLGVNGVKFIGRVGNDEAGVQILNEIGDEFDIKVIDKVCTGRGLVTLADDGQVYSVVLPGANFDGWQSRDACTEECSVLLLQREIPDEVNAHYAKLLNPTFCILDIGGSLDAELAAWCKEYVHCIAPNLHELQVLCQETQFTNEEHMIKSARALNFPFILLTCGKHGSYLIGRDIVLKQPAFPIDQVIDETGAGDAFRAAFATEIARLGNQNTETLAQALHFAAAAGALAVTRQGAVPSLPTRDQCQKLIIDTKGNFKARNLDLLKKEDTKWEFASRLNSMKARPDLFDKKKHDNTIAWIERQAQIPGLSFVDLNFPQHFQTSSVKQIKAALHKNKLKCGAICLRFPQIEFGQGALTNPNEKIRKKAQDLVLEAGKAAQALETNHVIVWPQFDGYDYPLSVDHFALWTRTVQSFQYICDALPELIISLEYKPTDEKTRYFAIPSAGAAVALAHDVQRVNFGLTIDVGHCLAAGENPAQSMALAASKNLLKGVQLNDWSRFGTEDGLVFGSCNYLAALDVLHVLKKANYDGHLYFDTFPRNEDPVAEADLNIRQVNTLLQRVTGTNFLSSLSKCQAQHDALALLNLVYHDQ